jgi:hypothetical protein
VPETSLSEVVGLALAGSCIIVPAASRSPPATPEECWVERNQICIAHNSVSELDALGPWPRDPLTVEPNQHLHPYIYR